MCKSAAAANIAIVETLIKEFSNLPDKTRACVRRMGDVQEAALESFALRFDGRRLACGSMLASKACRGLVFAIRDCACKPYTQWRYPTAAIMAAAIIDVIRRRTAKQFRRSGMR